MRSAVRGLFLHVRTDRWLTTIVLLLPKKRPFWVPRRCDTPFFVVSASFPSSFCLWPPPWFAGGGAGLKMAASGPTYRPNVLISKAASPLESIKILALSLSLSLSLSVRSLSSVSLYWFRFLCLVGQKNWGHMRSGRIVTGLGRWTPTTTEICSPRRRRRGAVRYRWQVTWPLYR